MKRLEHQRDEEGKTILFCQFSTCFLINVALFRFFNYRGRGGYYNRNAMNPGGYRGGNMNYNRGSNYRPRTYNRNYNSNSTGIPQQNKKPEQSEAAPVAAAGEFSF